VSVSELSEAVDEPFHELDGLAPRGRWWLMDRDDLLLGQVGDDDSGDADWDPEVGGYLGDRM